MSNYIKGVDISVVQGNVDFQWLVNQGIQFVIVRCGVGNDGADVRYSQNIAGAKAAGLKVMAYHFVYPLPPAPGKTGRAPAEQAKMHFDAAKGELACVDIEWPEYNHWSKWGCTPAQINQWLIDYLKEYERLSGQRMPVYTYPSYADLVKFSSELAQYPLWIASYTSKPRIPKPWTDWQMWQTEGGKLLTLPNGMPVDTNVAKDLSLWESASTPAPEPSVEPPTVVEMPPSNEPAPQVTPSVPAAPQNLSPVHQFIKMIFKSFKF